MVNSDLPHLRTSSFNISKWVQMTTGRKIGRSQMWKLAVCNNESSVIVFACRQFAWTVNTCLIAGISYFKCTRKCKFHIKVSKLRWHKVTLTDNLKLAAIAVPIVDVNAIVNIDPWQDTFDCRLKLNTINELRSHGSIFYRKPRKAVWNWLFCCSSGWCVFVSG